jgi:hypothetical protein
LEALIFGGNRRTTFLRACVFGRIIDAVHFFIISANARFQERSQQMGPWSYVDPRKGDGKRYVVQSDELMTAFLELEAMLL